MVSRPPGIPDWLAKLYPFAPKSFPTPRGAQMSYLDEGPRTDEAVLMLHGNPTWSFYYRDLVRELSPHLRCVVPDHIGMGLSSKPGHYDYRLANRISDIEGLVDSLGLRRVHLVVHDWGGAIGFGFATRQPERVGSLVIMNTAAFPSATDPEANRALPPPPAWGIHRAGAERLRGAGNLDGDGLEEALVERAPGIPVPVRQLGEPNRRAPFRARHPA